MLKCKSCHLLYVRQFGTSTMVLSKASKRRKDTKLKLSPNLQKEAKSQGKPKPTKMARDFFDSHYKQVYGSEWPSIRLALLSKPKFAAMVNNFSNKDQIIEELTQLGCINIKTLYSKGLQGIDPEENIKEDKITLPDYEEDSRPSMQEDHENFDEDSKIDSMSMEEAQTRLIDPENIVIGGKTSASMYEFVPSQATKKLEDNFVEESDYYTKYSDLQQVLPFEIIQAGVYAYPDKLNAFVHPYGVFDHFEAPKRLYDGPFNYFCLDAASLLPVLMLNLQKGDHLLDLCSGPGGKSVAAMQTLNPGKIVCNDVDPSRLKKVKYAMNSYLLDKYNHQLGLDLIQFSRRDGLTCPEMYADQFDKVLCDVPCYTDRHVLFDDDNNIFKAHLIKDRVRMPELQANLLASAIQCLKPGGEVVYSTCTLSPMQNDSVIALALKKIWEDTKIDVAIIDLSKTILPFKSFLNFSNNSRAVKYGQQILPSIGQNFGPMYFAKIKRLT